ncbi:MAG: amidohydrolase family protein [Planctomycetota bacterium]
MTRMSEPGLVLHLAAALVDGAGDEAAEAALAVEGGLVRSSGRAEAVRRALRRSPDRVVDHGASVILPAFVNAHAHLDLGGLGPTPYGGDFTAWAMDVARTRPRDETVAARAVVDALMRSREQGVGWIGDIAGSEVAVAARLSADDLGLPGGTSWLECFGIGRAAPAAAERAAERLAVLRALPRRNTELRIALQPHAPYSAGRGLYARAAQCGRPSTHLAETLDELRFVRDGDGPFADLLRAIGKWDDSIVGQRMSPVQALRDELVRAPWVLAHCNYLDDDDVATLSALGNVSIAYCPIASEYFGHRGHRYRELLDRGVNVCIGTDSILCQPHAELQPHGVLAQVRRLWRRDHTEPGLLLAMATHRGARALGLQPLAATLVEGAPARAVAVAIDPDDHRGPWLQVLDGDAPARVIA